MLNVANQAGVSIMTVSRIINGKGTVEKKKRDAVYAAIKALGYVPNVAAQNLAGNCPNRIGLLHDNRRSGLMGEFLIGCLAQGRRSMIQIAVRACEGDGDYADVVKELVSSGVSGLVLAPPLCEAHDLLDLLSEKGIPAVAVAGGLPGRLSVRIDDRDAAADMTRHILGLGHRRIGFIGGSRHLTTSKERLRGYQDALSELGISIDPRLIVYGDLTYHSGLEAAARLLDANVPPTAIFSSNDDMAAAVVAVAHRRGLDVPADLTVCGFDDTMLSTAVWPSLTTIHQPIAEMAAAAVAMLADMQNMETDVAQSSRQQVLNYRLIRRGSDAPLWPFDQQISET